jgi:uncharacterized protein (DUF1330 family)
LKKGYWLVLYRTIPSDEILKNYGALAGPAVAAGGGKALVRVPQASDPQEQGLKQRTVVIEFESLEKAVATYESSAYQEARKVLGSGVERDFRIVEGL